MEHASHSLPPQPNILSVNPPPARHQRLSLPLQASAPFQCPRCPANVYSTSEVYIQHLNSKHQGSSATPFRCPSLPDLTCCHCNHFCRNSAGLKSHQTRKHRDDPRQIVSSPPPASSPEPNDPPAAYSEEQLSDLFSLPLYDIHRAWRAPLFRIAQRLSRGILDGTPADEHLCTVAFLLLPGLIAECQRNKWVAISTLLAHFLEGIDSVTTDSLYAGRIIAQARHYAPLVHAARQRSTTRTASGPLDPLSVAAIARSINGLVRDSRLGAANRKLDRLQLVLQSGSQPSELGLSPEAVRGHVERLHPPATDRDTFTTAHREHVSSSTPVRLLPSAIKATLRTLNRGAASGVSGLTNAFLLDVFSDSAASGAGLHLLTDLSNKMLAGELRSPLWLRTRVVLIPKPSDSSPPSYRPLGIPETFYRLAGRAAMRELSPAVGLSLVPVQLGVGVSSGCQIGARAAQCAYDARLAILSFDVENAFNTQARQDIYEGLCTYAPELLRYFLWAYGQTTPLIWHGLPVGDSATGCRQGDPAGTLYYSVGTQALYLRIKDAVTRLVAEDYPLLPSYSGVHAICDDLTVLCDPQLAHTISATVQAKFLEAGKRLNVAKSALLVHPGSAHLVGRAENLPVGAFPVLSLHTNGIKLLGAPIGTETFRKAFVARKIDQATSSVPALTHLAPWATWSLLRHCINERINYLAQVTEYPLVHGSLQQMDASIDRAIFHVAGLRLPSATALEALTSQTLRSLPTALGGLGIRRYGGLAGEIACLRARQAFYEFAEEHGPLLLRGASTAFWSPISLGEFEDSLWATTAGGLFHPDPESTPHARQPPLAAMFPDLEYRSYYLASGEPSPLIDFTDMAVPFNDRRDSRQGVRGPAEDLRITGKAIHGRRFDALLRVLESHGKVSEACLLRSNSFERSGSWLAGPGGYLSGTLALSTEEYKMALRLRLLTSPASLDVGDSAGAVLCRCNRSVSLVTDPFHCLHCPSSQGQFIRRHNHVRDSLHDLIEWATHKATSSCGISVEVEPLLRILPPDPASIPDVPDDEMDIDHTAPTLLHSTPDYTPDMDVDDASDVPAELDPEPASDSDPDPSYMDVPRPFIPIITLADRRRRDSDDRRSGRCRGDLAVSIDGRRTILDVAIGDATAPSYRMPPSMPSIPFASSDAHLLPAPPEDTHAIPPRRRRRSRANSLPRLSGQSYAIEHRTIEKKTKFRRFLGTGVDDPDAFVAFILEASGKLGPSAAAFLTSIKQACPFPILRFRSIVSALSTRHNAKMALRWVRYLRSLN